MPHPGKPSGACQTCKRRHIRCDETRPGCIRCLKSNRVCPGYAEGLDLVLRDQNGVAKASVGRREKAAQRARLASGNREGCGRGRDILTLAENLSLSPSPACSAEQAGGLVVLPPPSYLAPSEDDYQLCLFMGNWVLFPHDVHADRGFITLLPSMYSFVKLDTPLALCVAAISSVLSTKFVLKVREVEMADVRRKYIRALRATRQALEDPVESLTDETLMAVCLLGFYEGVVDSFRGKISSARHFDGAAALIHQRQGRLSTVVTQKLLLGVRNSILHRALAHSTPIDTTSPLWQDTGSLPHNAGTLLDQMSVEIPNILVAVSRYQEEKCDLEDAQSAEDTTGQRKADIIAKALAIDANLSTWPNTIPPTWTPIRLSTPDIPRAIITKGCLYQDHCDIYPDVAVCETWNSYRVARFKVLTAIAQLASPTSSLFSGTVGQIQELADAICASVPYGLGDRTSPVPLYSVEATYPTADGAPPTDDQHRTATAVGGWSLFSPMKEVMRVGRWLRPGQSEWMGGQLHRLAAVYDVEPEEG